MNFRFVTEYKEPERYRDVVLLIADNWNDYWFYTLFSALYFDEEGKKIKLGIVKVAKKGMEKFDKTYQIIINEYGTQWADKLTDEYFSLGDEDYYNALVSLPTEIKNEICEGLKDIIYDSSILDNVKDEEVVIKSLFRDISVTALKNYNQILFGKTLAESFSFNFTLSNGDFEGENFIDFKVNENDFPPSNFHVIIGKNGVGKSSLLREIANITTSNSESIYNYDELSKSVFSKIVYVALSVFDTQEQQFDTDLVQHVGILDNTNRLAEQCENIRTFCKSILDVTDNCNKQCEEIKKLCDKIEKENKLRIKNKKELAKEYAITVQSCVSSESKLIRLRNILSYFEYDELFSLKELTIVMDSLFWLSEYEGKLITEYEKLSSGHSILLLLLVKLVDLVENRTLVLLDEPESHLHPPFLSAFIRAVSYLVKKQSAFVICATHSPLILQEVPRKCVWKLTREGDYLSVAKPIIETYGESLSLLYRDVFGVEVEKSSYVNELKELSKTLSFEEILEKMDNQLGMEGKMILANLMLNKQE